MTVHYHGTPITPLSVLNQLAGRHFCVSHARPDQINRVSRIAQSIMLDNGAFSRWRLGKPTSWPAYYAFCDRWLDKPTTWAVIPDEIDAGAEAQNSLLAQWPFKHRGAPVWHMDEPVDRLLRLTEWFPKVCVGSTSVYAQVLSPDWQRRMDEAWDRLMMVHRRPPWVHMLRGMRCVDERWPFASVDSTDLGRNHNRAGKRGRTILDMLNRWDVQQCPDFWNIQDDLYFGDA